MVNIINIEDLTDEIKEYLSNFNTEIQEGVNNTVDIVSKEVNEEIKKHITFKRHDGDRYVKSFRIAKTKSEGYLKVNTWYVANGQHGLTHLLENGHALEGGGRTREFPHIIYGEELAKKRMPELLEEVIRNAGH
jgi:hypothetical protein